jgi:hypothetical protein
MTSPLPRFHRFLTQSFLKPLRRYRRSGHPEAAAASGGAVARLRSGVGDAQGLGPSAPGRGCCATDASDGKRRRRGRVTDGGPGRERRAGVRLIMVSCMGGPPM